MAKELGVKQIVIDSLAKCGLPFGDGNSEKRFVDTLAAAAKALDIHIHLVSHLRKPPQSGEANIPNKFDVKGAGELTDLVDNVMLFWMDKKRANLVRLRSTGNTLSAEELTYIDDNPTHRMICCKQRHGAWEGTIPLWFDPVSLQFLPNDSGRTLPFAV